MSFLIRSRKFYSQVRNGENFTDNLTDFTPNLVGTPGEKVKAEIEFEVFWNSISSNSEIFTATGDTITRPLGSFITDGFQVGDEIQILITLAPFLTGTIIALSDKEMVFDSVTILTGTYSDMEIHGITELTSIFYSYSLDENADTATLKSQIDLQDQTWYADQFGIAGDVTPVDGEWKGKSKSGKEGSFDVHFVSFSNFRRKFIVEHVFKILPYWLDGYTQSFEPEFSIGDNSLRYSMLSDMGVALTNPNISHAAVDNTQLGSVAWFQENFNGLVPNYRINTVLLQDADTLGSADGILLSGKTKVTIEIEAISGASISADTRLIPAISYLPTPEEYQPTVNGLDSPDDYDTIWLYDSVLNNVTLPVKSSSIITDFSATLDSAALTTLTFFIEYTPLQIATVTTTQQWKLWVLVGSSAQSNDSSDKMALQAGQDEYVFSADIPDLMFVNALRFYEHDEDGTGSGHGDIKGWVEDGILARFNFDLETDLNAFLTSFKCGMAAYNETTGDFFEIDSYDYNLGNSAIVLGVQQIDIEAIRGFILADGDPFNRVELKTGTLNGTLQNYTVQLAYKIPWQDWQKLQDANDIFFDSTKENNGQNKNTSNYSGVSGYGTVFFIDAIVDSGGVLTTYRFISPDHEIHNYDEDGNNPADWIGTILTENLGGVGIEGNLLLGGEDTVFKIEWEHESGTLPVGPSEVYAINRLEPSEGSQQGIAEQSSIRLGPDNDALQPLEGETLTTIVQVGQKLIATCRTVGPLISSTLSYKLSGTLKQQEVIINKILESGDNKILENSDNKILD